MRIRSDEVNETITLKNRFRFYDPLMTLTLTDTVNEVIYLVEQPGSCRNEPNVDI